MIEIDMQFFYFGLETLADGRQVNYLFRTKAQDFGIQSKYVQHHQTLYLDKAYDKTTNTKKIVTFGIDYMLNEEG